MSTVKVKNEVDEALLNETINGLTGHLSENPGDAEASFSARSSLQDGFQTTVNIRDFEFASDEPEQLGGTDTGPNPVEYVLGALAACQEIVVKTHAALLDITVNAVEVEVKGDLDLQGFLNISEQRAGFTSVSFETTIDTDEQDSDKLRKLKELTLERCPVLDIIQNPVPVEGKVSYIS
ncbi:MAG: OsmC family protein [Balneolaceae bacterium]|nr:OsmC family protein [Balneolaceae bacterium]